MKRENSCKDTVVMLACALETAECPTECKTPSIPSIKDLQNNPWCDINDIKVGKYVVAGCNAGGSTNYYEGNTTAYFTYDTALTACSNGYHLPTYEEWKAMHEEGASLGYQSKNPASIHVSDLFSISILTRITLHTIQGKGKPCPSFNS